MAPKTICEIFSSSLRTASSKATPVAGLNVILLLANTLTPPINMPERISVCTVLDFGKAESSSACMPSKSLMDEHAAVRSKKYVSCVLHSKQIYWLCYLFVHTFQA